MAHLSHYVASKFAVIGFTNSIAKEVAETGITVNAICPGGIFRNQECDLYIKTVNPALGEYFNKSHYWKSTSHNGKIRKDIHQANEKSYKNRLERKSYCHKYIGNKISGYEDILFNINTMRTKNQLKLL